MVVVYTDHHTIKMFGAALSITPPVAAIGVAVLGLILAQNGFLLGLVGTLAAALLTAHVFTLQQTLYALVETSHQEHYVLYQQMDHLMILLQDAVVDRKYAVGGTQPDDEGPGGDATSNDDETAKEADAPVAKATEDTGEERVIY